MFNNLSPSMSTGNLEYSLVKPSAMPLETRHPLKIICLAYEIVFLSVFLALICANLICHMIKQSGRKPFIQLGGLR